MVFGVVVVVGAEQVFVRAGGLEGGRCEQCQWFVSHAFVDDFRIAR